MSTPRNFQDPSSHTRDPGPQQRKCAVLITGPPGNSLRAVPFDCLHPIPPPPPPPLTTTNMFSFSMSLFVFFFFKYSFICLWGVLVLVYRIFSCGMPTLICGKWDLVPWPGTEPRSPTLRAQTLSHWITREVSQFVFWSVIDLQYYVSPCYTTQGFSMSIHFETIMMISLVTIWHRIETLHNYWPEIIASLKWTYLHYILGCSDTNELLTKRIYFLKKLESEQVVFPTLFFPPGMSTRGLLELFLLPEYPWSQRLEIGLSFLHQSKQS